MEEWTAQRKRRVVDKIFALALLMPLVGLLLLLIELPLTLIESRSSLVELCVIIDLMLSSIRRKCVQTTYSLPDPFATILRRTGVGSVHEPLPNSGHLVYLVFQLSGVVRESCPQKNTEGSDVGSATQNPTVLIFRQKFGRHHGLPHLNPDNPNYTNKKYHC